MGIIAPLVPGVLLVITLFKTFTVVPAAPTAVLLIALQAALDVFTVVTFCTLLPVMLSVVAPAVFSMPDQTPVVDNG